MKYTVFFFFFIVSYSSYSQFVDYNNFFGIDINDSPFDLGVSRANDFSNFKNQRLFRIHFNSDGYIFQKCNKFNFNPAGEFDFSDDAKRKKENCEKNLIDKSFFNLFTNKTVIFKTQNASTIEDCKILSLTFSAVFSTQKMNLILNKLFEIYKTPESSKNMSWGKLYSWQFSNKQLMVRRIDKQNEIHVDYYIK